MLFRTMLLSMSLDSNEHKMYMTHKTEPEMHNALYITAAKYTQY